ncbi:UNVERIFIED_CONTAM: hypothetical protein FKN15_069323 [Acipenser sinensis]
MSLVAYASSDDSDSEDAPNRGDATNASKSLAWTKKGGIFSSLPAPKNPNSESQRLDLGGFNLPPPKQSGGLRVPPPRDVSEKSWIPQPVPKSEVPRSDSRVDPDYNPGESKIGFPAPKNSNFGLSLPPPIGGVGLNLPRPKKRAEPVKITVPEIHQGESDSDEDEPVRKKETAQKKGDQPTGQQRRKHQITYLIHQAKERELELKNSWAENKLTRRQTQAKYGF